MKILIATGEPPLEILIKRSLSRFKYEWDHAEDGLEAFQKAITRKYDLIILDFDLPRMNAVELLRRFGSLENFKAAPVIVLTLSEEERMQIEAGHFSKTEVISRPMAIRKFVAAVQQILNQNLRISCLGGGTGLFTLLLGLKTISGISLSSIVTMSDDGGSTGKLRDMFGILPPGDIRRSLIALSSAPDLLNEIMQYRFQRGQGLEGHNLGNLLLTALSEMRGSMSQAVKAFGEILDIQGQVLPVTETINTLKAELENGALISGEHRIDLFEGHDPKLRIKKLWQEPSAVANPDALESLFNAHYILMGPGDLFTSIIPNLIVEGIADSIARSQAKKIYICNIMTKPGETTDFTAVDHISEIIKYLKNDALDYVICSSTPFSPAAIEKYKQKSQVPVEIRPEKIEKLTKEKLIWADVASEHELVRHDSLKLASEIKKVFEQDNHQSKS